MYWGHAHEIRSSTYEGSLQNFTKTPTSLLYGSTRPPPLPRYSSRQNGVAVSVIFKNRSLTSLVVAVTSPSYWIIKTAPSLTALILWDSWPTTIHAIFRVNDSRGTSVCSGTRKLKIVQFTLYAAKAGMSTNLAIYLSWILMWFRAVFNWVSKVIHVLLWFCFISICDWLKISRHFWDQPELKPKPFVTSSHVFPHLALVTFEKRSNVI